MRGYSILFFAFLLLLLASAAYFFFRPSPIDVQRALAFAKEDPLLALPGVDVVALRASIDALGSSVENLADILAKRDPLIAELTRGTYPIPYLHKMAMLEEKRRIFIEAPSENTYGEYEREQKETLALLIDSVEAYTKLVDTHVKGGNAHYTFAGGSARKEDFLASLARLKEGLEETNLLLTNRARCLRETLRMCGKTSRQEEAEIGAADIVHTAPETIRKRAQLLESSFPEVITKEGPYRILKITGAPRCLSFLEETLYFALFDRRGEGGLKALYPHLLNDLYFWDATTLAPRNPDNPYFASMVEFGIPYSYQPVSNFYMCPDNIRILTPLATALALEEKEAQMSESEVAHSERFQSVGLDKIIGWLAVQNDSYTRGVARGYFPTPAIPFVLLVRAPFPLMFLSFNASVAGAQEELVTKESPPEYLVPFSELESKYSEEELKLLIKKALLFQLGYDVLN